MSARTWLRIAWLRAKWHMRLTTRRSPHPYISVEPPTHRQMRYAIRLARERNWKDVQP